MINPVFIHYNCDTHEYVVSATLNHDFVYNDTSWMNDKLIGNSGMVPSIDIVGEQFVFETQQEALQKLAKLYADQLQSQ